MGNLKNGMKINNTMDKKMETSLEKITVY